MRVFVSSDISVGYAVEEDAVAWTWDLTVGVKCV